MQPRTIFKAIISVALLLLLYFVVDLDKLSTTLSSVSPFYLLLLVLGYAVSQVLSALKWKILLHSAGISVTLGSCIRGYFIGMLVNIMGIGTLGGDMARALLVSPREETIPTTIASVVADRAHGLAVLSAIGAISLIFFGTQQLPVAIVYLLTFIGMSAVIAWLIGPWLAVKLFQSRPALLRPIELSLKVFSKQPRTLIAITAVSIVFHLLQIGLHRFMGLALGLTIPWEYLLVAVPFTNIVSTLPLSWQGLGVRENAYRYFFARSVLSNEQVIAFGAMWFFTITILGCLGGTISLLLSDTSLATLTKRRKERDPLMAESPRVPPLT